MSENRINPYKYSGNGQYVGTGSGHMVYCWGHKEHKLSAGGRVLGKLKLWYCAECAPAKIEAMRLRKLEKENQP